eukprot:GHVU01231185.1.p3 GENE.GHVU01231185.1~~GHVU01231185.1.p3  ORF type:complete len:141 (-),score=20.95 GHVU01231185.1:2073-2495(-)
MLWFPDRFDHTLSDEEKHGNSEADIERLVSAKKKKLLASERRRALSSLRGDLRAVVGPWRTMCVCVTTERYGERREERGERREERERGREGEKERGREGEREGDSESITTSMRCVNLRARVASLSLSSPGLLHHSHIGSV